MVNQILYQVKTDTGNGQSNPVPGKKQLQVMVNQILYQVKTDTGNGQSNPAPGKNSYR